MYNENSALNLSRESILNRAYREVGVDVYMDSAHHKVWITQDFGLAA
jgi:uncharacterized protein YkwD